MRISYVLLTAALVLTSCIAPVPREPLAEGHYDPGGSFPDRLVAVVEAYAEGRGMPIRGRCYSSCALKLAAGPNVCVAPTAIVGVHEVRNVPRLPTWVPSLFQPGYEQGVRNESLTRHFERLLPTCARDLFVSRGGFTSGDLVTVLGLEILLACPKIRACS